MRSSPRYLLYNIKYGFTSGPEAFGSNVLYSNCHPSAGLWSLTTSNPYSKAILPCPIHGKLIWDCPGGVGIQFTDGEDQSNIKGEIPSLVLELDVIESPKSLVQLNKKEGNLQ